MVTFYPKSQTPQLPQITLTKSSRSYKILIPDEVEKQIRYLCQEVSTVEWSGVLFYTYEGSFEDGSLVIICKDIYVMDIGTAAYTEFDISADIIAHMTQNPELLDTQMGLIHSHNNMSTFFSGTDLSTLKQEGNDRNHFVSLIVNNAGVYTAGITRKLISKKISEIVSYKSFGDVEVTENAEYEESIASLEWFNLDITFETPQRSFHSEIDSRLAEIREAKKKKPVVATYGNGTYRYGTHYGNNYSDRVHSPHANSHIHGASSQEDPSHFYNDDDEGFSSPHPKKI